MSLVTAPATEKSFVAPPRSDLRPRFFAVSTTVFGVPSRCVSATTGKRRRLVGTDDVQINGPRRRAGVFDDQ